MALLTRAAWAIRSTLAPAKPRAANSAAAAANSRSRVPRSGFGGFFLVITNWIVNTTNRLVMSSGHPAVADLEQPRETRVAGAADRQPPAVPQDRHAAVLGIQLDAGDPLDVQQIRAVDPYEARRIERRFDGRHR